MCVLWFRGSGSGGGLIGALGFIWGCVGVMFLPFAVSGHLNTLGFLGFCFSRAVRFELEPLGPLGPD